MKKIIALGTGAAIMSVLAVSSVFAQSPTTTTTVTPSPTTATSPTPTGSVQGATVPSGAPSTGFGSN